MPAKVISVINYKGGVGKTASTFNIGTGINFLTGAKVLLVDIDPQCSLTNICLKTYSRLRGAEIKLENLDTSQTINHVIKRYLVEANLNIHADLNLDDLIIRRFYKGERCNPEHLDLIAATMFDSSDTNYQKGLDDLEIEMAAQHVGKETWLRQLSIFTKFFEDTKINEAYDFIIFDCPPANNLITQNALVVSDYYLIPTIMDDMSANGIDHLHSLIQNTIFGQLQNKYGKLFDQNHNVPYFKHFTKGSAELLGIFETLKKSNTDTSSSRDAIEAAPEFRDKLLSEVIYHHIATARSIGQGYSVFSVNVNRNNYSPHLSYGKLVFDILDRMGISYTKINKMTDWL